MLDNSYQTMRVTSYHSLSKGAQAELDAYARGLILGYSLTNQQFTVSTLVGEKHGDWEGTPLNPIYQYHLQREAKGEILNAQNEAGKDMGRIFKNIMAQDKVNKYIFVGIEQKRYPLNIYKKIN